MAALMMNDEELERLPPLLKEIVLIDRRIADYWRNLDKLETWDELFKLRRRRRELTDAAARVWGPMKGKEEGGTA
jgi:hypothetical protein